MQKKIIALAVAGLASTAAFAQTNVTIYGVADAYVGYGFATDKKNLVAVNSGGLSGSRLGFKGVEDLGNGLKAIFTIEYSVNLDSVTGATAARQQYVGLTGGFGTAVAGYLQTTGYDFSVAAQPLACSVLDANNAVRTSATAALIRCTGDGNGRLPNAVAYISPTFGGVTLALNHARLTENSFTDADPTTNSHVNNAFGTLASVSYAGGPVTAGLVYGKVRQSDTALFDDWREYGIRGGFDFGVAKVFGSYQNMKSETTNRGNSQWQAGVAVPVGKATIVAQYAENNINSTVGVADGSQAYSLGATYALSKRSTVYGGMIRTNNSDAAALGVLNTPRIEGHSTALALGLRHMF